MKLALVVAMACACGTPIGLTLNDNGVISGVARTSGSFMIQGRGWHLTLLEEVVYPSNKHLWRPLPCLPIPKELQ